MAAANLALVYALIGEQDQAITLIERLLSTPGPFPWLGLIFHRHYAGRSSSALGVGLAAQQSALPEDPRRTGAEDDLLESVFCSDGMRPSGDYATRGYPCFEKIVASIAPKERH